MCGFFGIIQENPEKKVAIKKISALMEHRGPDDWGWLSLKDNSIERGREDIECSGNVILSHQRLSIIDLTETGWQPMVSGCERFSISYNGEIYNYIELKNELINLGHSFHSDSDTEVILESWKEWGIDCVKRFKGMFAFSLLDKKLGRIFAPNGDDMRRDNMGRDNLGRDNFVIGPTGETLTLRDLPPTLAKLWYQKQGLPFVFARFCYHGHSKKYKTLSHKFLRTSHKIPQYILDASSKKTQIDKKDILEYLKLIEYKLDPHAILSLKRFIHLCDSNSQVGN